MVPSTGADEVARFFEVGQRGPRLLADPAAAVGHFARCRAIVAREAVDPALLAAMRRICDATAWTLDVHSLGDFLGEPTPHAGRAMEMLLRAPALLRWLEAATGCGALGEVKGHIARTLPEENHRLRWHNDLNVPGRRLAITVNLGSEPYDGGVFELRDVASKAPLFSFVHRRPGDAVIFEVSARSEHRVTRMTAGGPRQVFAGWFLAAA